MSQFFRIANMIEDAAWNRGICPIQARASRTRVRGWERLVIEDRMTPSAALRKANAEMRLAMRTIPIDDPHFLPSPEYSHA